MKIRTKIKIKKTIVAIIALLIQGILLLDVLELYTYRPEHWQLTTTIVTIVAFIECYLAFVWDFIVSHPRYFEGK